MTREEAEAASAKLNDEHPDRDEFRWFAKRDEHGEWAPARIRLPKPRPDRLSTSTAGKQPPPPDEHPLDLPGGVPPYLPGAG
jgi:hypothetical protein